MAFAQLVFDNISDSFLTENQSLLSLVPSANNLTNITQSQFTTAYNQGVNLLQQAKPQEALTSFEAAISINPNKANAWHNRGQAFEKLGNYTESLMSYEVALSIDPTIALTWNNRGAILYQLGRYDEALQSYGEAIALDPTNADFQKNKDLVSVKMGNANATSTVPSTSKRPASNTASTYNLVVGNNDTYPINYNLTSNLTFQDLTSVILDQTFPPALIVDMSSETCSNEPLTKSLAIEIPREVLDAKDDKTNNDSDFTVQGAVSSRQVSANDYLRTLEITLYGCGITKIIGTQTAAN